MLIFNDDAMGARVVSRSQPERRNLVPAPAYSKELKSSAKRSGLERNRERPVCQTLLALRRLLALAAATAAFGISTELAAADGDPVNGAAIFVRECALCHSIGKGEPNRFGPNLFGIAERKAGTAPGYQYSPEFITMATWTWSPDGIASFVVAPGLTIPGNKMSVFQGVADAEVDDLIAYLAAQK
jgi:cytochrome c